MILYDSITVSDIPPDAPAVAGYVNGRWPTFSQLERSFPGALKLSITVNSQGEADCLDVEPGDASAAGAAAWLRAAAARGAWRPCVYASASSMGAVLAAVAGAGLDLADFRFWSAHYGAGEHICGPGTCRLVSRAMDGTQWTDSALGRNLDQSLLADGFFEWSDVLVRQIPTIQEGSTGQIVRNWQGLLLAHGTVGMAIDGSFGPKTKAATMIFQTGLKVSSDGVVGPGTWAAALTT